MKLFLSRHPFNRLDKYPFRYSRCVQPIENKDRHVIKVISNHLTENEKKQPPSRQLLSNLDQGYAISDPLCDAWIEYAIEHTLPAYGMPVFNHFLNSGGYQLDKANSQPMPQALKDLFIQTTNKPDWYDFEKILLACKALMRYPFQQGLVLQSISLMGGYCVPALAEPLLATGQLTDNVAGRIARTLCFLTSVMIPQGLEYNADNEQWEMGFKQTLKTRVIHALVRYKLRTHGYSQPWDEKKFGVPINQTDMIATNMSFSLMVIHGLSALDCELTLEEKEAILNLWRYVGYIIGIDDVLMPKTVDECNRWLQAYLATQRFDSIPAKILAESLHQLPLLIETSSFKGMAKLEQNLRAGVTRSYWGDDICDDLGLPKTKLGGVGVFGVAKMQMVMQQLQKSSTLTQQLMFKGAGHYRNVVKQKYLGVCPEIEPLFDELFELAMRSRWE